MSTREYSFTTSDGIDLKGYCWTPALPGQFLGIIVLVHGLGEHIGRYSHVASYFNDQDYIFVATDLRGHGRSSGKRGDLWDYRYLFDDLELTLDWVSKEYTGLPVDLYGHSMGGNIVANYLIREKPTGIEKVLITSPWFKLTNAPSTLLQKLVAGLSTVFPSLTISNQLEPNDLSSDESIGKKYRNDPLVHNKISLRSAAFLFEGGLKAIENSGQIDLPILLMHGGADPITSPDGSAEFKSNARRNCDFKVWPGLKHEIHNEKNKSEVLEFITSWLHPKD